MEEALNISLSYGVGVPFVVILSPANKVRNEPARFRLSRAYFSYLWSGWSDLNRRPLESHSALEKTEDRLPPFAEKYV